MTKSTLTRLFAVPAMLATLAITGSALAGPGGGHGGRHGAPLSRIVKQLDLSADQEAIVTSAKEEAKASREATKAEMASIKAALEAEFTSPTPDKAAIYDLMEQKSSMRLAKEKDRIDTFLELQATFTPEQQAEFESLVAEGKARRDAKRAEWEANGGQRGQGEAHRGERGGGKHHRGGRRHQGGQRGGR